MKGFCKRPCTKFQTLNDDDKNKKSVYGGWYIYMPTSAGFLEKKKSGGNVWSGK